MSKDYKEVVEQIGNEVMTQFTREDNDHLVKYLVPHFTGEFAKAASPQDLSELLTQMSHLIPMYRIYSLDDSCGECGGHMHDIYGHKDVGLGWSDITKTCFNHAMRIEVIRYLRGEHGSI